MSIVFDKNEVLKIAEEIERSGSTFYRSAADCGVSDDIRQALLDLAELEEEHEKTFASMKEETVELDFDPYHEAVEYLHAFADNTIFHLDEDICKNVEGKEKVKDIFSMAIASEKETIVFYHKMMEVFRNETGKNKINMIIKDEMKHIVQLNEKLKEF